MAEAIPNQQPAAVPFAINPAAATAQDVLNFTNKLHKAHYDAAIKSLYADDTERFDLSEGRLQNFLSRLDDRAKSFNLKDIIEVPLNRNEPLAELLSMCTHHGQFTLDYLRAFASTYIGSQSRAAQDDNMLYEALVKSLTEDAYDEITDYLDDYTVNGTKCGLLLLKVIIRESTTDATIAPDTIRQELANSPLKFRELGYDVTKFNSWVRLMEKQLRQHGETSTDLRTHIFAAYQISNNEEFRNYIASIKDQLRDKRLDTLTPKTLMAFAKSKVDQMEKDAKYANIGSSNNKDEHILALEAQLLEATKKIDKLTKSFSDKKKPKGNFKKDNRPKPFPKELKTATKPDDSSKPRVIDGVQYWWCDKHQKWGRHKTSECRTGKANSSAKPVTDKQSRTIKAVAALIGRQSDSDSE